MKSIIRIFRIVLLFSLISGLSSSQTPRITSRDIFTPEKAENGMVVSSEELASAAGSAVLKKGGNAVDAAVTTGFVLAVTLPRAGNIGGGGFMLIYSAEKDETIAIDYREKAPRNVSSDMFLDENGKPDKNRSRFSHLASGVPGTVAGFTLALDKYGTMTLAECLEPAIRLARDGFKVTHRFSSQIRNAEERLKKWKSSSDIFFKQDADYYKPGDIFIQKDLARTLTAIAEKGSDGFYAGKTAELIVREMKEHNGLITKKDLINYKPIIKKPVKGRYRGYTIYSMPPPSSGGVHIIQMLNILKRFNISDSGHNSALTIHYMAEAMKYAFADRSKYLGDPDFFDVPVDILTSKEYCDSLGNLIIPDELTRSSNIFPGIITGYESDQTTHFSIVDKRGNSVSNTYTINFSFGSGIVVEGAGFLLNNEMDDFSAKPGEPNAFGLIGGEANSIQPEKRMLSSMSPVIILKDEKPFLVTGSPGGPRIITTVLQIILNVIDHGMNIQVAVNASRIHHQWLPEQLLIEGGISPDTIVLLGEMGYNVKVRSTMGAASSIFIDPATGMLYGAADPRAEGSAVGY